MDHFEIKNFIEKTPWAILPSRLEAIIQIVDTHSEMDYSGLEAAYRPLTRDSGAVAVISVFGIITQRPTILGQFFGDSSTLGLTKQIRAAADDPSIKAIVLDVDSPGGTVGGVEELSREIFRARGKKPITAVCNSLMASAAYWIGSAASEVVITPSGELGSIGVFMVHEDISQMAEKAGVKVTLISAGKHKTEGNQFEPLSAEARQNLQEDVNNFYTMFINSIARNRGVSTSTVRNGFGEGRLVSAKRAVNLGMADRVATLDETLARLSRPRARFGAYGAISEDRDLKLRKMKLDLLEIA